MGQGGQHHQPGQVSNRHQSGDHQINIIMPHSSIPTTQPPMLNFQHDRTLKNMDSKILVTCSGSALNVDSIRA
jgi:hypothetical protein